MRGSSLRRSDQPARTSPAAHPSVRRHRCSTCPASRPCAAPSRAAASASWKRRSSARISTIRPRTRSRPSRSGGSIRVPTTRVTCGGSRSRSRVRPAWTLGSSTRWRSSSTIRRGGPASSRLTSTGTVASAAPPVDRAAVATTSPLPGRRRSKAEATSVQNREGSRSTASIWSHATSRFGPCPSSWARAASSVVLPAPAGALTSTRATRESSAAARSGPSRCSRVT